MKKSELVTVLQELDARLFSVCDVAIVGGAAMILHFGASRATRDVDILAAIPVMGFVVTTLVV